MGRAETTTKRSRPGQANEQKPRLWGSSFGTPGQQLLLPILLLLRLLLLPLVRHGCSPSPAFSF